MTSESIAAILGQHYPAPVWCACGWRAPLSLNDTQSDRQQTLDHVAQVLAAALPEATETVEWGARRTPDEAIFICFSGKWQALAVAGDAGAMFRRTVRTYEPQVGEWEEVRDV